MARPSKEASRAVGKKPTWGHCQHQTTSSVGVQAVGLQKRKTIVGVR